MSGVGRIVGRYKRKHLLPLVAVLVLIWTRRARNPSLSVAPGPGSGFPGGFQVIPSFPFAPAGAMSFRRLAGDRSFARSRRMSAPHQRIVKDLCALARQGARHANARRSDHSTPFGSCRRPCRGRGDEGNQSRRPRQHDRRRHRRARRGQFLQALIPALASAAASGRLDLGSIIGQIAGGGAGGAILTAIVALIKNMMANQAR